MPRRKRDWRPNVYYHVVMRGNNRHYIFKTDEDMYHLIRIISQALQDFRFSVAAFCIMSNHYHLLIQSEDELARIMRQINRRYSDYYCKRYRYVGTIYQQRYFSKSAEDPHSLLYISRYIHRNPIETNTPMVTDLADYYFSSFPVYAQKRPATDLPFLKTGMLPELLPPPMEKSADAYVKFCMDEQVDGIFGDEFCGRQLE
ncbi:transposase [Sporosarcina sp.]|uniref:transposase n=1 Tax=Sporosarcina sp. TaxID=49982 RepID=UPI00262093AC|nr:transposase [Sporosarcina sp.]